MRFTVHSAVRRTVSVPIETKDGRKLTAQMQAVEIELVPEDDDYQKTVTFLEVRDTAEEADAVLKAFAPETFVEVSFQAVKK